MYRGYISRMSMNVLVAGASIAGLSTAYWLDQLGHSVTIVEIAGAIRTGGTAVDLRGNTVDVIRRMGIFDAIKASRLGVERIEFVNPDGSTARSFPTRNPAEPRSDDEFEIERVALLTILADAVTVDFIFDDSIAALRETSTGIDVTFKRGAPRSFDLVIGADGIHSGVRRIWFGAEADFMHSLALYTSVTIVDKSLIERDTLQMFNVIRLRKYAGVEPGYKPFTDLLKQRELEQMAKPNMVYPSKGEMETELSRNQFYLEGLAALFTKYKLTGWEEPFAQLKTQLIAYDAWVKANLLPKARTDFRLPPEEYALSLEGYGVDIPPAQLAGMAHTAFTQYQAEMAPLAAQIAKANHYPSSDYRDVIRELKKKQITGDAILPFYQARLKAIEDIIVAQHLVTLPARPAIIRLATPAETAQQPAPHMVPPPFLHNTGQRGEFVLPLNIPNADPADSDKYDDFTYDAVAWTLTAHEARPATSCNSTPCLSMASRWPARCTPSTPPTSKAGGFIPSGSWSPMSPSKASC